MQEWTFGITTGGKNSISPMIDSIQNLNIHQDKYEIIVVGGSPISGKNIVHVPFDENQKDIWITKKKQIICEMAKFENVVLSHDYIIFDQGWYDGWLRFNDNDWDVAMNVIYNGDGLRFRDWCSYDPLSLVPYNMVGYGPALYVSGTYWVAKKQFMLKFPLDVSRGWGQGEDVEWSFRCRVHWNYKMNTYSSVRCSKTKETYGVQGEAGVHTSIHYYHLLTIADICSEVKIAEDNGFLCAVNDRGVRDIHYGDFDRLRNVIRQLKPKNIVAVGCPLGISAFAAAWAAQEYGGKLTVCDYSEGSYGIRLSKELTKQFKWENTVTHMPISATKELASLRGVDFAILGGTYETSKKIEEFNILKSIMAQPLTVFAYNGINDEIVREFKNGEHQGNFFSVTI